MNLHLIKWIALLNLFSSFAFAEGISTHVLDLATGVGGQNIPVTLELKNSSGQWDKIGTAVTEKNGRVKSFDKDLALVNGLYRLTFDLSNYKKGKEQPFFPEMTVVFRVDDIKVHYHVPIVVSPYGYSTYRGN